jgi:adenine-specific DNA-methyltransferase
MLEPQNRRYIGNKNKLLSDIQDAVGGIFGDKKITFADIFAGTGVVGYHFAKQGHNVIVNDTLYSNFVAFNAWLGNGTVDNGRIAELLRSLSEADGANLADNYFSEIYGKKYYSVNNARTIGHIRERVELLRTDLTEREYFVILTSLLFCADKIANTVGHFEHYLKKSPEDKEIILETLNLPLLSGDRNIYNEDANTLARKLGADVVYIDPPYNARQYVNFYHVLENLARWEKPAEFEGVSMKFKRDHLKSGYCRVKAPTLFAELILSLKCRLIIVSYNNTYEANSVASNNRMQEDFIVGELSKKGKTTVKEIEYKPFSAGNTNFKRHLEKLYICEVESRL